MADWTDIEDSQLDPDAPLTSDLAYAWRDNPIAIAEGAVGAPRISHLSLMAPVGGAGVVMSSIMTLTNTDPTASPTLRPIKPGTVSFRISAIQASTTVSVSVGGNTYGPFTSVGLYGPYSYTLEDPISATRAGSGNATVRFETSNNPVLAFS